MNRIEQIFQRLRQRQQKGLMPFITAGDPDLSTTARLLHAVQDHGGCICELGIPFSDPIADGPVIQASMTYALNQGVRPGQIFDLVRAERARLNLGLVAMVSYSIVHRLEPKRFIQDAAAAGIDGFIFPDLPIEEAGPVRELTAQAGLTCSFLIAPTTPLERAERIAQACSGFIYVLARAGITGESKALPADLTQRLARLRQVTDLPIAVGFGISDAQQVAQVTAVADAAIVGSAIMRRVAQERSRGSAAVVQEVTDFVTALAQGLGARS